MQTSHTRRMVTAALLAALAVVGSTFSFPILGSKCAPVQHLVNVLCAFFLGPFWGLGAAFVSSLVRNLLGLGTPLAFPGSMCGALLSGLLYQKFRTLPAACAGEVLGTAVIGGMLAFPIAKFIMGNGGAALFTFVVPFLVSTAGGSIIAFAILTTLQQTKVLSQMQQMLN